jgi:hypothetical protein
MTRNPKEISTVRCDWSREQYERDGERLRADLASRPPRDALAELERLIGAAGRRERLLAADAVMHFTCERIEERLHSPGERARWVRLLIRALRERGQGTVACNLDLHREARELERAASGGGAKP